MHNRGIVIIRLSEKLNKRHWKKQKDRAIRKVIEKIQKRPSASGMSIIYLKRLEAVNSAFAYAVNENLRRLMRSHKNWDLYSAGGYWSKVFLVKQTCREYYIGERNWICGDADLSAPDGYKWVCGARKKDIEWELMQELATEGSGITLNAEYFIDKWNFCKFVDADDDVYIENLDDETVLIGVDFALKEGA